MIQLAELHYRYSPQCDCAAVKARAQELLESELDSPGPGKADRGFLIIHKEHAIRFSDGEIPAQTAILGADQPPRLEAYEQELQQSWATPHAKELLRDCRDTRLVTEMMTRSLPPQDRVSLFHGVLRAMIELTNPDAMVCKHSQQVVEPAEYLTACDREPILRPGSLNVRFFNISNSGGDMIMDTRGLTEVGLHDLQCHFRDLGATAVARLLFNTAVYIFENGPVIESGHSVAGIEPDSKWLCQFENSLLEPKREVLDVNPGEPFAAGNR
ncbi:MAG: DUF4261 domain-containing protein [Pirellulales bacterium]